MPKLKTHKGAKKRFKVTAKGKILRQRANKSHLLTGKSSRRTRRLKKKGVVSSAEKALVRKMMPYAF
ncbi:MAG: 50S ribosomal protein L35 [Candidatus Aminicenantes bacterium]|nr:50S ribosomal protein L35 [Candidatus Aminicenantes bacterium]